ncbi:MAG: DUF932 domain-containing protein [Polyangiales bacterium]
MNATALVPSSSSASPSPSLSPRPDQRERWFPHLRPVSFDEAASDVLALHAADGARSDVVTADLRSWAFGSGDGSIMQLVGVPFFGRQAGPPLALRELAFRQLCDRIDAPATYLRELPAKLQIANVNYGLLKKPQPALLRMAGGDVRAVLSERYAPIDDQVLFELVADALDHAGLRRDAVVRASSVGTSTVLRITLPAEGVAVKRGDVIEYGIDLGNSEVGLRSVQVVPTTYRLLCTNGMRGWQSEAASKFRHIGDPARLRELLRDALPLAFAEARGDLDRWKRSTELVVDSVLAELDAMRASGLSGADAQAVARIHALESGLDVDRLDDQALRDSLRSARATVFDLANGITATAKTRGTTARLGLEEAAHRYLVSRTR